MARLRNARGTTLAEAPLHYEGVPMRTGLVVGGWTLGLGGTVGGIVTMILADDTALEVPGALLAAIGALVLAAVVRCRRVDVTLGKRWFAVDNGPLRHRVPVEWLRGSEARAASSWRRLYSDREVVVALSTSDRELVAPSHDPEALTGAIAEHCRQ